MSQVQFIVVDREAFGKTLSTTGYNLFMNGMRQARLNHEMKAARDQARVKGIPSFERARDEATGLTTAAGGFVMA